MNRNQFYLMLFEQAVLNQGIYPAAIVRGKKETKRTEWQDGWNAAIMSIFKDVKKLSDYCDQTFVDTSDLELCLEEEIVGIQVDDDRVYFVINVNDVFVPAADIEIIDNDEIELVVEMYNAFSFDGVLAFVSIKRQEKPMKKFQTDKYNEAVQYLKNRNQ